MKATIFYRDGSTYTIGNITSYNLQHKKVEFSTKKYIMPGGVIIDSNVLLNMNTDVLYIVVKDFGMLVEVIPGEITSFKITPSDFQMKELQAADAEIQRVKESRAKRCIKNAARLRAHIKEKELARQNSL